MRPVATGLLLLALLAGSAHAQDDAAARQRRIDEARAAADARFEAESAACRQRFAVNACLDDARQRRRQALAAVQAEQRALDEAGRRERAADRRAEVARKQAEVARRTAAPTPAASAASAGSAAETPSASRPRAATSPRAEASDAAAKAAARAEAARKRQEQIKADQARIQARIDKRAAQGKQPLPLPPVPGASMPR